MDIEPFALVTETMEVYVNLRIEKHGDDNVNGYDIKLSGSFANHAILPKLDAELLPALYTDDKQRELDEFKKKLRFPRLFSKAVAYDWEVPRVVATLHDEHDAANSLVISDCTADKFSILAKELGIVELGLRVKTKDLTEDQVMKLLRANGQELNISLECKPAEEKPDNFQQALDMGTPAPDQQSEAWKAANAVFTEPPPGADNLPALEASAPPPAEAPAAKPAKKSKPTAEPKPDDAPLAEKQAAAPRPRRTGKTVVAPE